MTPSWSCHGTTGGAGPSAADVRAEIGLATRNLVITGAQVVVNGSSTVELSNVHLLRCGQVGKILALPLSWALDCFLLKR